ncbi:hypothetical protein [Micromonospora marina]|uniref:hypothetical protein n=1 Tax=Micromonospora marina TaxID=307120 RepID=UPI003454B0E5
MPVPSGAASSGALLPIRATAQAPEGVTAASPASPSITNTRTVYVFGLAALALPAGLLAVRRARRDRTPAEVDEEAYALGRADERAADAPPAAKVLPFRKR